MDSLPAHREKLTKQMMEEYEIKVILNVPYSPDLNPVESLISIVKNVIRRRRTANLIHGRYESNENLINRGLAELTKQKVQSCIRYSKHLIYKD